MIKRIRQLIWIVKKWNNQPLIKQKISMVHQRLPSLLIWHYLSVFLSLKSFPLASPSPHRGDLHNPPSLSLPGLWALLNSLPPPTVLGVQGSVYISPYFFLCTLLLRQLIFSQLVPDSCINTTLMNFKSVTSHSTLYSRHFKTSSLTCPALSWELNTSSVKNRIPLQCFNFYWSITIFSIPKPKIQLWLFYFLHYLYTGHLQILKKHPSKFSCNTGDQQVSGPCHLTFGVGLTCLPTLCHSSPIPLYSGTRLKFLK